MKFRGRIVFKQYTPKKRKRFGIKMFKLFDSTGYTYDMNVYLGKYMKGGTTPDSNTQYSG